MRGADVCRVAIYYPRERLTNAARTLVCGAAISVLRFNASRELVVCAVGMASMTPLSESPTILHPGVDQGLNEAFCHCSYSSTVGY